MAIKSGFGILLAMLLLGSPAWAQEKTKVDTRPLRELAAKQNVLLGAASTRGKLNNPKFRETCAREFNSLTVENELKCAAIAYFPDRYVFNSADYIIAWAEKNNMKVRGHTLVWHSSVPKWILESGWDKEKTLAFLKDYITTTVTRYKGRLYAWDVVNEIFDDLGRLRDESSSFWYKTCGDEYIEKAFIWAHEADPDVKLFINDYGVETINFKSTATYELAKKLLAKGVPIHGFGMQAHMTEGKLPDFKNIAANIKRFTDLGLEVQVTELDVRIADEPAPEAKQFQNQAEVFRGFVELALANPKITCITTWGVSDSDSWIPGSFKGFGAALMFDEQFAPKPAYAAVADVLTKGRVRAKPKK
jgi:endo-1,4-beta-xylanase